MKMLEKVRGYRLIAKIIAIAVFIPVGLQLIHRLLSVAFGTAPTYGLSNIFLLKYFLKSAFSSLNASATLLLPFAETH